MIAIANVPRETLSRIDTLKQLVLDEAARQNLVSASTIADFDNRHMLDSMQLREYLPDGDLIDIGSGGGFPGLVLACFADCLVHLVEPRTRRAEFLRSAVEMLGLQDHARVHISRIERLKIAPPAAIIARAVAPLEKLFAMAVHLADENTRWVLPKGRSAASELEEARRTWQGSFRLVPSMTDDSAAIVIAEGVRRRQPDDAYRRS